jgi:hypothetical protein
MSISELELNELKSRTANALRTKSLVAKVDDYIQVVKDRIGSDVREQDKGESKTEYLYSLIILAEIMPASNAPDTVRVLHRDRFIKKAVSEGKFTMSVARTVTELAEQLTADLSEASQPSIKEVEVVKSAEVPSEPEEVKSEILNQPVEVVEPKQTETVEFVGASKSEANLGIKDPQEKHPKKEKKDKKDKTS